MSTPDSRIIHVLPKKWWAAVWKYLVLDVRRWVLAKVMAALLSPKCLDVIVDGSEVH
jgi:hypothetical protein